MDQSNDVTPYDALNELFTVYPTCSATSSMNVSCHAPFHAARVTETVTSVIVKYDTQQRH